MMMIMMMNDLMKIVTACREWPISQTRASAEGHKHCELPCSTRDGVLVFLLRHPETSASALLNGVRVGDVHALARRRKGTYDTRQ
jgi:hypothetical protein